MLKFLMFIKEIILAPGKKSIAFNVTFEPKDKTLSEKDIDQISKKIISTVQDINGRNI